MLSNLKKLGDYMDNNDKLKKIQDLEDIRARASMNEDWETLECMLSDNILYSHSTGYVDTKSSYFQKLRAGNIRYLSVKPQMEFVSDHLENMLIGVGRLSLLVEIDGLKKEINGRFMSVWNQSNGEWKLQAIQGASE